MSRAIQTEAIADQDCVVEWRIPPPADATAQVLRRTRAAAIEENVVHFLSDLMRLVTAPVAFFDALNARKARSSWLPIATQIVASALLFVIYYRYVNLPWLREQLLVGVPAGQHAKAAQFLTGSFLTASAVISVLVTVPLITAIIGLYFFLVGKVRNVSERFGQWFLMTAWASMVSVLNLPIGLATILTSDDGRVRPGDINPLTLDQLLLHLDATSRWRTFAESINALLIVEIALLGIGYARWARVSVWAGIVIASLPFAVIYGIWAIVLVMTASA